MKRKQKSRNLLQVLTEETSREKFTVLSYYMPISGNAELKVLHVRGEKSVHKKLACLTQILLSFLGEKALEQDFSYPGVT